MNDPVKSGATPLEGDGKRILMIVGNPKGNSLGHALAEAYAHGARGEGHVVRCLKLGDLQFDPVLHNGYEHSQPLETDLVDAQRQIHWAQHLVIVYPVWWGGPPALLKGFFERVMMPGFAFKYRPGSPRWDKLLSDRTADIMVTLDTPTSHWRRLLRSPAHRQITRTILDDCGIKTRHLAEFAPVSASTESQRQNWLRTAENLGTRA